MQNVPRSTNRIEVITAVNFSESKISTNPSETLVAHFIGSGIAVSMYDAVSGVGALLNFILPDSSTILPEKAKRYPCMFADTGMRMLLDALAQMGIDTETMKVVIAGGAQILDLSPVFDIGHKNYQAITSILSRENLIIHHEEIGGRSRRTLRLEMSDGFTAIQTVNRGEKKL